MAGEHNTTTFLPLPIDLFSAFRRNKRMAKFLNKWILALGLIVLVCVGCKQSNSKDVGQMTVAELQTAAKQGHDEAI
jgi:branched-subunit amino acid transport protein AzlD